MKRLELMFNLKIKNMKNFSLFLAGFVLSAYSLISCLGGSNVVDGLTYGILDYGKNTPIMKTADGVLYASSFASQISIGNMNINDCYLISYRYDSDLPENASNVVETNG